MDDLFISYSRRNIDFVRRLHERLTARDLDVWVDWQDIPPTRDWWQEIKEGIEGANALIFVISPDSLSSSTCHLEVAHAKLHNKRLIPLLLISANEKQAIADLITRQLDDNTQETLGDTDIVSLVRGNWQEISRHNWLLFETDEQFDRSLELLLVTLKTDYEYVKQHTLWGIRSVYWDQNGRKTGFLLHDAELKAAQRWLADAAKAKKEPAPSELQTLFIAASRKYAQQRHVVLTVLALVALASVLVGLGVSLRLSSAGRGGLHGQFNILLTTFGEIAADGTIKISEDSTDLTKAIVAQVEDSQETIADLDIGVLWLNTLVNEDTVSLLADDYDADIVIYGYLDASSSSPVFQPHFYYNPLLTGADEITGESTFGAPIPLLLDENVSLADNPLAQPVLDAAFTPRVNALASFLYGLAAFKVDLYTVANQHFTNALNVPGWNNDQGKEILYLWIGTLFEKNYAQGKQERLTCPIPLTNFNGEPSLDCAMSSYERAVGLNDQFARGYLGLGNTYLSLANYFAETGFVNCSYMTDNATYAYTQARLKVEHADPLILMKSYGYNGTAYLYAYELGLRYQATDCLEATVLVQAVDSFQAALRAYETIADKPEAQQLAVRLYFQLALIYGYQDDPTNAVEAFDRVIDLAGLPGEYPVGRESSWRQVRWDAYVRRAELERKNAEETQLSGVWDDVLNDAQTIIKHRDIVNDVRFVSAAYFYAGLAYEALGRRQEATDAYAEALGLATPDMRHFEELQTRAAAFGIGTSG